MGSWEVKNRSEAFLSTIELEEGLVLMSGERCHPRQVVRGDRRGRVGSTAGAGVGVPFAAGSWNP